MSIANDDDIQYNYYHDNDIDITIAITIDNYQYDNYYYDTMCVWAPQTIAKLVQITPITIWDIVDITIMFMLFTNQLATRGPHIAGS